MIKGVNNQGLKQIASCICSLLSCCNLSGQTLFTDVALEEKVQINHIAFESPNKTYSTGAVWFDCDNDGDLDLFVTNPSDNKLFRNNRIGTGEKDFTDITAGIAIGLGHGGSAVVAADYDNDGDDDLYLSNRDVDLLLQNDGHCHFTDVTKMAFPDIEEFVPEVGTTVVWGDINNDGWLDLYVGNHTNGNFKTSSQDYLFISNGGDPVTFTDRSDLIDFDMDGDEVGDLDGFDNASAFTDFNKDGLLDIYTANDCPYGPEENKLWQNFGELSFLEVSETIGPFQRGVFTPDCFAAMGIARGDPNHDGFLDYHMSSICFNGENTVLLQNNGNSLINISQPAGLDENIFVPESGILFTWGTIFIDYDLDTWQDLAVGGGSVRDVFQPNFLYQNQTGDIGDIPFFKEIQRTNTGLNNGESARTLIMGDYDMDGDPDIYLSNLDGVSLLYRNNNDNGNHWLIIETQGAGPPLSNKNGIGAKLYLTTPDHVRQYYEIYSGSGLGGGDDMASYFGLGNYETADLEIVWPSGVHQYEEDIIANQRIIIKESHVMVSYPAGGDIMEMNDICPIQWTAVFADSVDILLYRGDKEERIIALKVINNGIFDWQIENYVPAGQDYRILVRNSVHGNENGMSERYFTITEQGSNFTQVLSPNGDELWEKGNTYEIKWESSPLVGTVSIQLYRGNAFELMIGSNTENDGSFSWEIPEISSGNNFKIEIKLLDMDSLSDKSNAPFVIKKNTREQTTTATKDFEETEKPNSLIHIFPNPVIGNTRIELQIPNKSYVSLDLFNQTGSKIKNLFSSELTENKYTVPFNAQDLSFGIYFCVLSLDGQAKETKKLAISY